MQFKVVWGFILSRGSASHHSRRRAAVSCEQSDFCCASASIHVSPKANWGLQSDGVLGFARASACGLLGVTLIERWVVAVGITAGAHPASGNALKAAVKIMAHFQEGLGSIKLIHPSLVTRAFNLGIHLCETVDCRAQLGNEAK